MNTKIKKAILDKIKEYSRIIITRHFRPDGDCIGATKGLREILKDSFPEKEIYLLNEDYSDYLSFLGGEDEPISDDLYKDALVIILDTATIDRVSNKKAVLGKEIIKIDHHVDIKPFGNISWVEEHRSSLCELIVDFYLTFKDELVMSKQAALYLYTGMVTDSGRFKTNAVNGETLRLASVLLDKGIDTESLYANLYMEDFGVLKFKSYVYKKMKITENGVCYIYVDRKMQKKFNLTREQASNAVSFLDGIKGCLSWMAFIENMNDNATRVRMRSRFMTINKIAEQYRGGGHECASGATVYSKKEAMELVTKTDEAVKEYKRTHTGWL